MPQPTLSIYTQTPYTRLLREDVPHDAHVESLREGVDHLPSPGGVTRMMRVLLGRLESSGRIGAATWVSLSSAPPSVLRLTERTRIEHVRLAADEQAAYARAKAALWDEVHALSSEPPTAEELAPLGALSRAMSRAPLATGGDIHYVHDFQLLPLGRLLPRDRPRVFRWHIPFSGFRGSDVREFVADSLNEYDAVVVSTRAYAKAMRRAGVRVPVHVRYPYLDESRRVVTADDVAAFDARWGIRPDDVVFVLVARLDPMKCQDVAIRALAELPPNAKLVLVGGGGFSSGRAGLGLDFASRWRSDLETLARELGVEDRVVFTGGIPDHELEPAYTRARAVLLPSALEGFGLVAVEGWLHGKPALVSRGCGVAELVQDGYNGYTFAPGDHRALAARMRALLDDPEHAARLGRNGRATARACHSSRGAEDVWEILHGQLAHATREA